MSKEFGMTLSVALVLAGFAIFGITIIIPK